MSRQKQLGTAHETHVVEWLKAHGWPFATRKTLAGASDKGDIQLSERVPFVIEAKTSKASTDRAALGQWMKELEEEVANSNSLFGAVVHKKRGTTDVGEYYVIMPVKFLNVLLRMCFGGDK